MLVCPKIYWRQQCISKRIFRESDEYKSLQRLCMELNKDPQAKQIFNQMNHLNSQLQQKQMTGSGNWAARSCSFTKYGGGCPAK